jgi:hypothetical protein
LKNVSLRSAIFYQFFSPGTIVVLIQNSKKKLRWIVFCFLAIQEQISGHIIQFEIFKMAEILQERW